MTLPPLIFFDLDNTLATSKQPLDDEMADILTKLLHQTRIAITSGGGLPQFLKQVVSQLPEAALSNLYLLPTSGSALYEWKGEWHKVYEEKIRETDVASLETAAQEGAEASGCVDLASKSWGPRIEYRGTQVTFSALGQEAPPDEKAKWDPTKEKRLTIRKEIAKRLPHGYSAMMGGATSIDIVKEGIDKGYGVHQLCMRLNIREEDALYVGDQLEANGNDETVYKTEVKTKSVDSPADTKAFLKTLLTSA
jgi:phosphomannomutase